MSAHLNKSIALIVSVVVGIILLHNLYMYEIDYGVKIHPDTEQTAVAEPNHHSKHDDNVEPKALMAVFIVLNAISLTGLLLDYFSQDPSYRSFQFDFMDWKYEVFAFVSLFTYMIDAIVIIGLLGYLVYLVI